MIFEAGLGGIVVVVLMIVEIMVLVLAVAGAEAGVDVEARVLLLLVHQGATGAHLLEPTHPSLEAADVQRLHALVDRYSVEDTQFVAFSAPSEKTHAVPFRIAFRALDFSIDLLPQATLLLRPVV